MGLKTCATCEHLDIYNWCNHLTGWNNVKIEAPYKQSCTEHSEKVEKKKVLLRFSLSSDGHYFWVDRPSTARVFADSNFIRWLTPEDMRKIIEGKEIEVDK